MKLWGGRFEHGPAEHFEQFSESLSFDQRLFFADIEGTVAWVRALARIGIFDDAELKQVVNALEAVAAEARDAGPAWFAGATDEDVHTLVLRKITAKIGDALAGRIHTGRSRNEQVGVDVRLWLKQEIGAVIADLDELLDALVAQAERHPGAALPGYTHTRRAQPILWAHYCLAYFEMFARDRERLLEARRRTNVMPLGSGALAGSGFPFDRQALAADLGFEAITRNSMDVSADRDFALDFLHAASLTMLHLSRLAEDWILYSGEEYGWMELGDEVTSGSSLMPQKKNPDSLELIRGKCGRVFGSYNALFLTMKGLPMTYNRDMQEDKVPLFEAADEVSGSLEMAIAVIQSVKLHPAKPAAAAEESWVVATDLAEALARAGTPFHQAHQIVGRFVLESVRSGKKPADWTAAEMQRFAPEFTGDLAALLDPRKGMKSREIPGGTGPESVAGALAAARQSLAKIV